MASKTYGARNLFSQLSTFQSWTDSVDKARRVFRSAQACGCLLEAGLSLAVAISIAAIGPTFSTHTSDLMREHAVQLLIAAFAVGLCIFERGLVRRANEIGRSRQTSPSTRTQLGPLRAIRPDVITVYFGRASCSPRSGGSSFPLRRSFTA